MLILQDLAAGITHNPLFRFTADVYFQIYNEYTLLTFLFFVLFLLKPTEAQICNDMASYSLFTERHALIPVHTLPSRKLMQCLLCPRNIESH